MKKSITRNAIYKILLNVFNIIVPIIIGPYAYRVLGPEYMGRVTYTESIYTYFFIFAAFGIYQYGLREVSRIRDNKEKTRKLFTSLLVIGVISNLVVFTAFISFSYIKFYRTNNFLALIVFSINIISNMFYVEWANEALEKFDFITKKTIIIKVFYLVLLFTYVKTPEDYIKYIFLLVLSTFLNNIISFIFISRDIGFDFKDISIKKHLPLLVMTLVMANANLLYTQLDRIMLGSYISEKVVSYYALCYNIITIINTLILSIVFVTVPRLSNILGSNDEEGYISLLNKVVRVLFAFIIPSSIGIICLSEQIIRLFSGDKFLDSINLLKVFAVYMLTIGAESILTNQILYVKREEKTLIRILFIGGIANVIFNFTLVALKIFNPFTAIITTTISNTLVVLQEFIYARRKLKIPISFINKNTLKYLAVSITFIPVTMIVKNYFTKVIPITILTVLISSVIYVFALYITKDEVFTMVYDKLLHRFKNKPL